MRSVFVFLLVLTAACGRTDHLGKAPSFTQTQDTREHSAMIYAGLPARTEVLAPNAQASLWSKERTSLLGDRRALTKGDILTVVIEIDDKAEISNKTNRTRSAGQDLQITELFGVPQRIDPELPGGASLGAAVDIGSQQTSRGDGSVRRNEKLTLRVAATVVNVMPNGVLSIEGQQEVRVNFELRELLVTGFVRPADISRQNEITYDKIAQARISYGGRGQITDLQQPRYGQQVLDYVLPF